MLISSIIRFCFPSVHVLYACFQVSLPFNIGMLFLWESCSMISFLKPYVNFQNHQDSDTESVDSISRDGLDSESVSFFIALCNSSTPSYMVCSFMQHEQINIQP